MRSTPRLLLLGLALIITGIMLLIVARFAHSEDSMRPRAFVSVAANNAAIAPQPTPTPLTIIGTPCAWHEGQATCTTAVQP